MIRGTVIKVVAMVTYSVVHIIQIWIIFNSKLLQPIHQVVTCLYKVETALSQGSMTWNLNHQCGLQHESLINSTYDKDLTSYDRRNTPLDTAQQPVLVTTNE